MDTGPYANGARGGFFQDWMRLQIQRFITVLYMGAMGAEGLGANRNTNSFSNLLEGNHGFPSTTPPLYYPLGSLLSSVQEP